MDSDTYALAYDKSNTIRISTFTIDSDGDITAVRADSEENSVNHASGGKDGGFNSLVQVDSDTYALAYTGLWEDGFITTFTISSDGNTITEVDTLEHDVGNGTYNSLVQAVSYTHLTLPTKRIV